MRYLKLTGTTSVSVVALAVLGAQPAFAQDAATDEAAARTGGVQEIVVTAQKRAESLQDTPISISALDSAAL